MGSQLVPSLILLRRYILKLELELGITVRCPHCRQDGTVTQIIALPNPRLSQDRVLISCVDRDDSGTALSGPDGVTLRVNHNVSLSDLARLNAFS